MVLYISYVLIIILILIRKAPWKCMMNGMKSVTWLDLKGRGYMSRDHHLYILRGTWWIKDLLNKTMLILPNKNVETTEMKIDLNLSELLQKELKILFNIVEAPFKNCWTLMFVLYDDVQMATDQ